MPIPRVIDLSHHNSVPVDLKAAKAQGIIGCIHKLTEGTSYIDDKVEARRWLCQDARLLWGIYHFLRPTGSMQAQAEFMYETAMEKGLCDDQTCWVADHEDEGVSGEHLKEFLDHLEELTGHSPIVYSGHVLKEQLEGSGYKPKRRLWLCQYTSGQPTLPDGVDAYWLWQYSDSGYIADLGPIDLNHFDGDDDTFIESWSGREPTPAPEPEPDEELPVVQIAVLADRPVRLRLEVNSNIQLVEDEDA